MQLTGTGLTADDLYLLAHHDVTGRPFLQPRPLGLGLAGALLAELVLTGRVRFHDGLTVIADRTLPHDELGNTLVGLLLSERQWRPAGDWLAFLSRHAAGHVADRLAASGYLVRPSRQRPWQAGRWLPADADCAFAPLFRAGAALDPGRMAAEPDVTLAGLAMACGLGPRLLPYGPAGARSHLDAAVRELNDDLRELIARTQAAVDAAVLSHRR